MANNCFYQITVVGEKASCEEWLRRMKDYDARNHFYRMFIVEVDNEEVLTNGDYKMQISGDCAWSLESCCRASGYSHGVDLFAVNTEELGLDMEAYSEECGLEFAEHYIYKHGECVVDDVEDFREYFWDRVQFKTYEEYKDYYIEQYEETPPDENMFDEDGVCKVGGFEWTDSI